MSKIRVVVAEPGKPAEICEIDNNLDAMQAIVGGHLECLPIFSGHDMWINEEGFLLGLSANRLVAASRGNGSAWEVVGSLFIADHNDDGDTVSLTPDAAAMLVTELNGGDYCRALRTDEVREPGEGGIK